MRYLRYLVVFSDRPPIRTDFYPDEDVLPHMGGDPMVFSIRYGRFYVWIGDRLWKVVRRDGRLLQLGGRPSRLGMKYLIVLSDGRPPVQTTFEPDEEVLSRYAGGGAYQVLGAKNGDFYYWRGDRYWGTVDRDYGLLQLTYTQLVDDRLSAYWESLRENDARKGKQQGITR